MAGQSWAEEYPARLVVDLYTAVCPVSAHGRRRIVWRWYGT